MPIDLDKLIRNEERRYFRANPGAPHYRRSPIRRDRVEDSSAPHSVYIIAESSTGPLKIGIAANPEGRLADLQVGNPRPLLLVHSFACGSRAKAEQAERNFHRILAAYSIRGEWFDCSIEEAIKQIPFVRAASGSQIKS